MQNLNSEKLLNVKKGVRMCLACRKRDLQTQMLRLTFCQNEIQNFSGFGRSFYVCEDCIALPHITKKILKIKKLPSNCENQLKEIIYLWKK